MAPSLRRGKINLYIAFSLYANLRSLGDELICERCSNQIYMVEKCDYCGKMVCESCEKSAKRLKKVVRTVICKDCWGNLPKRSKFKAL